MTENNLVLPINSYDGIEVIDNKGRKITIKNPTVLDLYNFNKSCVVDGKVDEDLKSMGFSLCFIDKIDGNPFNLPSKSLEVIAALKKFHIEDFALISDAISKHKEGLKEEIKK